MIIAVLIAGAMLFVAAVLAVVRVTRGPSMLDRTIALDVFTATLVSGIALEAAWHQRTDTLPILLVLSMVGFVGSVAIARFAAVEPSEEDKIKPEQPALGPLALLAEQRRKKDRARNPERYRATADESEHHGGGADGSVR